MIDKDFLILVFSVFQIIGFNYWLWLIVKKFPGSISKKDMNGLIISDFLFCQGFIFVAVITIGYGLKIDFFEAIPPTSMGDFFIPIFSLSAIGIYFSGMYIKKISALAIVYYQNNAEEKTIGYWEKQRENGEDVASIGRFILLLDGAILIYLLYLKVWG